MQQNLRKNINKILNEVLGVPDNIHEIAVEVYENFMNQVKWYSKDRMITDKGEETYITLNSKIADYNVPTIKFTIYVNESSRFTNFELMSMTFVAESEKPSGGSLKMKKIKQTLIELKAQFVAPEGFEMNDFVEFLKQEKNEIVESLSHELKHAYDHYKSEYESVYQRAEYDAYARRRFGINAVDTFFHDLYFTTASENLVRPSEVVSAIKSNNISQKEFLNFLTNHDTYLNLKRISKFDYQEFKNKIKKEMKNVDRLLSHVGVDNYEYMTDDEKVEEILRLVWVNIGNWKVDTFRELVTLNFLDEIMGYDYKKKKSFEKFVNYVRRFKNYDDFFLYEEKKFKYVANNMLRKISKLYAILNK